MSKKIICLIGSLRKKSINKGLIQAFKEAAPIDTTMEIVPIHLLPFFNADLEEDLPQEVQKFKTAIESADVILIATPEYNRSIPGVLKNAIDWGSRPYGANSFEGKSVFVISASPGGAGGAMGQYHLKQMLLYLNTKLIGQPEFWVGNSGEKFDENGILTDAKTKEFITTGWEALLKMT